MINTSRYTPIFIDSPDSTVKIAEARYQILSMLEETRGQMPPRVLPLNRQQRYRFAYHYVAYLETDWSDLRPLLFTLTTADQHNITEAREAYHKICGHYPACLEDITGLSTPLKAFFLVLWKKEQVLLPLGFSRRGVELALPTLPACTEGFFTDITKKSDSTKLKRFYRDLQYCVSWHKPSDVSVIDIWNSLPGLLQSKKIHKTDGIKLLPKVQAMIIPWLGEFSKNYPKILSAERYDLICRYHHSLSTSDSIDDNIESIESFEAYTYLPLLERAKIRRDKRNASTNEEIKNPKSAFDNNTQGRSAEELYISLKAKNRPAGLDWCTSEYYELDSDANKFNISEWVTLFTSHLNSLANAKVSKSTRIEHMAISRLFLDYLFAYLPAWIRDNPNSFFKSPPTIRELDRFIHFSHLDDEGEDEDEDDNEDASSHGQPEFQKPKTFYQVLPLRRSAKTAGTLIRHLHNFFERCKTNRLMLKNKYSIIIPAKFENPINLDLDLSGSGSRGSTNKIVLPMASMPLARKYIEMLNDIGIALRNKILAGEFSPTTNFYQKKWIDLKPLGLVSEIEFAGNGGDSKTIISVEEIPNCFHWKLDTYKNGKSEIKAAIPWMSTLRMLMIGLFAGQRIQGAQWLDINTFDKNSQYDPAGTSYWVSLFLNVDKTQPRRFVSIQRSVMKHLYDEKFFQIHICGSSLQKVFYENDKHSQYKEKITPLFRSPFSGKGLPFADCTYSATWVKVLKGIEREYNRIVPKENQHSFVIATDKGDRAVHTPHALRATWITYMRRYGGLEISVIQKQVGHANALMTNYYMALPADIQEADLESSDKMFMEQTSAHLITFRSAAIKPSLENSALQSAFNKNRTATQFVHQMTSKSSSFFDTGDKTGLDLIDVTNIGDFGFFDDCTCPFGGNCPKAVLKFTRMARCCGICPYAIFSLDNLPAVHAKIRQLFSKIRSITASLKMMTEANESALNLEEMRDDLAMMSLNMSGYYQTSELLSDLLQNYSTRNKYHVRTPDILKARLIAKVPLDSPGMRIVSDVIDGSQYPSICGENYLESVRQLSRKLHQRLDAELPSCISEVNTVSAQLLSIMRAHNWDIEQVTIIINEGKALALEGFDGKAKNQPK
jgi:hypothetical protein